MKPITRNILFKSALATFCVMATAVHAQIGGTGWVPAPVTFHVQWPYNTNKNSRYTFTNNVYHFLVYNDDKPFKAGNSTKPRTEQRFIPDYTNGEIQYQSVMKVPTNTSGVCIFQIHTGNAQSRRYGATTFMLFWFKSNGGSVHDYSRRELAHGLAGRWFQLNCDHNLATHTITVWINKKKVWQQRDNGAGDFYFKDGVYAQHGASHLMESYVRDIRIWTRPTFSPVLNGTNNVKFRDRN